MKGQWVDFRDARLISRWRGILSARIARLSVCLFLLPLLSLFLLPFFYFVSLFLSYSDSLYLSLCRSLNRLRSLDEKRSVTR